MSAYTDIPADWYEPDDEAYIVRHSLHWEIGKKGSGLWVLVPPGFRFDVSVPSWLQWLVNPHDTRFLKAAALHDWTLVKNGWDRVASAALFHDGLLADGVGKWDRLKMTLAVIVWRWR